jgi:folate-binding protein YgfZ
MSTERLRAAYADFQRRGGVVDLRSRVKLSFTGADRVRYLNGQVTANVASAKQGSVVPACVTTVKGKLCADLFVSVHAESTLVDADAAVRETLEPRFERYIVADDVTIQDVSETAALVHVLGVSLEELGNVGGITPATVNRYGPAGCDLYFESREQLPDAWQTLSARFPELDEELLEIIRIEHGVPRWGRELDENTLPPEAGLDRTHVDYHKGCYVGQEVISRIKSVGHVNRQLTGFTAERDIPADAELFSGASPGQSCGRITSVGWSFALERPIALGYLRRSAPGGDLFARSAEPGAEPVPITVCALPFTK